METRAKSKTKREPTRPNPSVAPIDGVTPTIEVDNTVKGYYHRIVCGSAVGQWTGYTGIAVLKVGDIVYRATTDYFHGALPTNVVFVTKEVRSA